MKKGKDIFLYNLQEMVEHIYYSDKLDDDVKNMVYRVIFAACDMDFEKRQKKEAQIVNFHN